MMNFDFYDIYSVIVFFRNYPQYEKNFIIAEKVRSVLDQPQVDNYISMNVVRAALREIDGIDNDYFNWIYTDNVYTYGHCVIHEDLAYKILSESFSELLICLKNNEHDRFADLSDALHNVPIILTEYPKKSKNKIKTEISSYRKKWNKAFFKKFI